MSSTRLAIVARNDPSAAQPFVWKKERKFISLVGNGEIYNHRELRAHLLETHPQFSDELSQSTGDMALLVPAFICLGFRGLLDRLNGDFAIALVDSNESGTVLWLARDPLGVKPLFWSLLGGGIAFASEMKAFPSSVEKVYELPAGTLLRFSLGEEGISMERFYDPLWMHPFHASSSTPSSTSTPSMYESFRSSLRESVRRRLLSDDDLSIGVLLSGGIDSAILAVVASQELKKVSRSLHTFTVFLENNGKRSKDEECAKEVASLIGSIHHEVPFSVEEGLGAVPHVIRAVETSDVITIRASVPLYLLSRAVSKAGIKVVLCGEGSDEVFAGYALFRNFLPSEPTAFEAELRRRLAFVGDSELIRVDRATMAWGVEARVPFLDTNFLETCMSGDLSNLKMSHPSLGRMEKQLLRDAFSGFLPDKLLYRPKEQFADGVGHTWIPALQKLASPLSEEAFYDKLFCEAFGGERKEVLKERARRRRTGRDPNVSLVDGSKALRFSYTSDVSHDPDLKNLFTLSEIKTFAKEILQLTCDLSEPSLSLLDSLISGFLTHIPFHNLTNLVRPRRPPTLDEIRQDVLSGLGGPCVVVNSAFAAMLSRLGFEVFLTSGTIHAPDCHVILLVRIKGTTYFVDVGNGKYYSRAVALGDRNPQHPSSNFYWRLFWNEGSRLMEVQHLKPPDSWPSSPSIRFDPSVIVQYSSFQPMIVKSRTDATYGPFLKSLRLARFSQDGAPLTVRDGIVNSCGRTHSTASKEELLSFIRKSFAPVVVTMASEAIQVLKKQGTFLWPKAAL